MAKLIFILLLLAISSFATWSNPIDIGPPINPDATSPTFATNGSFMIFASTRPGSLGQYDLWRSLRVGSSWQTPVNLGTNVNTNDYDTSPYLTQSATKLYFDSGPWEGNRDIYYSQMTGSTPGPKVNLGSPINTSFYEGCPVLTPDGNTLFFTSFRYTGSGEYDIWTSTKTGTIWGSPTNLGGVVNSSSFESPSWVSNDGNTLVFSSGRAGGEGVSDLWYTVKTAEVWGAPINFGFPINTSAYESGATFRCNYGQIGGIMYLTRYILWGSENIYTSINSGYINVVPASVGELKALYR